jgi:hypothetical protein
MATLTPKQQKAKAYYEANKEARKSYQREYNKRIAAERKEPWRKQLPPIREVLYWLRHYDTKEKEMKARLEWEIRNAQYVTVPTIDI